MGAGHTSSPATSGCPDDPKWATMAGRRRAAPSVLLLPLPAFHRTSQPCVGLPGSLDQTLNSSRAKWAGWWSSHIISSVVCNIQPKCSWLLSLTGFTSESPKLSGQRDYSCNITVYWHQGSKSLPKTDAWSLMEHMLPQSKGVVSHSLPPAAFYALHESKIAVISDIKRNQCLPTWTQQYWKTVLLY